MECIVGIPRMQGTQVRLRRIPIFYIMRKDIDEKKEEIIDWLREGISRAEVCKRLRCKYDTLKLRLDKWGIDYKNQSGKNRPKPGGRRHVTEYLELDGFPITSSQLKKKLYRDGLKEKICEVCGIIKWQGKELIHEIDHINGNRFDNRIENLRIICPNCHSQQPTNSGKNCGSYS